MLRFILIAVALALAPQATAAPCKTQGSSTTPEVLLDLNSSNTLYGLRVAFHMGLLPKEFPAEDIAKMAAPCSRGKLDGLIKPVELFGETENSPPRWAISPGEAEPYFFIAVMPKPGPAAAWFRKPKEQRGALTLKKGEWMSGLIVVGKNKRRLALAFFQDIPSDDRVVALVKEFEAGTRRALVGFEPESETFSVSPVE